MSCFMYVHIQLPHCTVVIQIQDHIITFVCVCIYIGHVTWHVGSQFPNQGSNLQPLHWNCGGLTTAPPGKSLIIFIESYKRTFQNSYLIYS